MTDVAVLVPRTIHHVWVGGPMPDELAAYRQTWIDLHPAWEHRLWGDSDLGWLTNRDMFDRAEEFTDRVGQFRSDVARYEILARYGGVYVDCDMEARRPIDVMLEHGCWAAWETDGAWINNAVIGAVPGHPLFADLIRRLPANVEAHRRSQPNRMTGPQFFTPLAVAYGIEVRPSAEFFPYRWDQLDRAGREFPDAYAVHHWHNARKRKGRPLPKVAA